MLQQQKKRSKTFGGKQTRAPGKKEEKKKILYNDFHQNTGYQKEVPISQCEIEVIKHNQISQMEQTNS